MKVDFKRYIEMTDPSYLETFNKVCRMFGEKRALEHYRERRISQHLNGKDSTLPADEITEEMYNKALENKAKWQAALI